VGPGAIQSGASEPRIRRPPKQLGCRSQSEAPVDARDGTTHVVFDPLDLVARLAALVPPVIRR